MVSVEQAVVTGYKLIWKNKKLLLIPLIWELVRLALAFLGLNVGGFGTGAGQFYLPLALPKLWFSIDDILPLPVMGPSLVGAFYPTLQLNSGVKMLIFLRLLPLVAFGAFLKGGYLGWIKGLFAGNSLSWQIFFEQGKKYFHRFFVLELLILIGYLILWFLLGKTGTIAPFIQKTGIMFVQLMFLVTSAWVIFADSSLFRAMQQSVGTFLQYGQIIIPFALAGIVINGLIAIPINWSMGNWLGLLIGTFLYLAVAGGLSVGLMYLFSGLEYSPDWKTQTKEKRA